MRVLSAVVSVCCDESWVKAGVVLCVGGEVVVLLEGLFAAAAAVCCCRFHSLGGLSRCISGSGMRQAYYERLGLLERQNVRP